LVQVEDGALKTTKMGRESQWGILEGFFIEFIPVADAESVHDTGVDEVEGVVGIRPGCFGAVVDLELW
jgi:hypothetical protein